MCELLTSSGHVLRHQAAACFHGLALLALLLIRGHVGWGWGVSWDIKRPVSEDETSCCCWQTVLHTNTHSLDSDNHHRICTPEMVSDFTYPSLAKPHANPFPTEMQYELSEPILRHTGKNNAENLHLDCSEEITAIWMLVRVDNDYQGFSAQISSNPKILNCY